MKRLARSREKRSNSKRTDEHIWRRTNSVRSVQAHIEISTGLRVCVGSSAAPERSVPLIAPIPIESKRLILRLVTETDLAALLDVNSNEEVTALLPYATWTSMADAEAWLERMKQLQATGLALQFVVVLKSTTTVIGTCLLFRYEEGSARAELGYVLGRAYWGQGFMQEALKALIDCAFDSMKLRRLEAEVDIRNQASMRLLRKLGFVKEGLLRQRWVSKGETKDMGLYGLLRHEWLSQSPGMNKAS